MAGLMISARVGFRFFNSMIHTIKLRKKQIEKLQLEIMEWTDKASNIQSKFNFTLPDYILDEIIENDKSKNYINKAPQNVVKNDRLQLSKEKEKLNEILLKINK